MGVSRRDIRRTMPPAATAATRTTFTKLFDEIGTVDQVGIEERVAKFTTRSIKKGSKLWGLKTAVSMVDLTTLEGKDTPGKIASLCQKARRPSADPDVPPVAAVANAIYRAVGVRMTETPMSPPKLLKAMLKHRDSTKHSAAAD